MHTNNTEYLKSGFFAGIGRAIVTPPLGFGGDGYIIWLFRAHAVVDAIISPNENAQPGFYFALGEAVGSFLTGSILNVICPDYLQSQSLDTIQFEQQSSLLNG